MSFVVVDISGKQFQVHELDELEVPKLEQNVGESVVFDNVLLLNDNGKTKVGTPTVNKAKVKATVIQHGRGKKIIVFKKKRRKDYKRTKGHRQDFTVVKIDSILTN